jgi:hypothetical protein
VSATYKFQLVAWPEGASLTAPVPAAALRTPLRPTAGGAFPSSRWKPGDRVRERFTLTLPETWTAPRMVLGLVALEDTGTGPGGTKTHATGAAPSNDPTVAILGTLPVAVPAPAVAPADGGPGAGAGEGANAGSASATGTATGTRLGPTPGLVPREITGGAAGSSAASQP